MEQAHKENKMSEEEILAIEKEVFMTSGGIKIGQSMDEYKAEREAIWNRMHPEISGKKETEISSPESAVDNQEQDDELKKRAEASESKRQDDLKKIRQELGLVESLDGPKINYIKVVIDDDYMRKNLVPNRGLRMKGGQANFNGEVDLMQYVVSDDISPEYRQIAIEKSEKSNAGHEKMYRHESHHIKNRENDLAPHVAAGNLREYLAFRVLDEVSAFTAGELTKQDMSPENILKALRIAEKSITDSYYGEPFSGEANWYVSKNGNKTEAFSRKIDQDKYNRILRQYFKIDGQDIIAVLQNAGKLTEFTRIINSLIIKLDPLLVKAETLVVPKKI